MRKFFIIIFLFGLILTLHRDTPGSDLETIWGARDQIWVSHMQGKSPTHCTITVLVERIICSNTVIQKIQKQETSSGCCAGSV